MRIRDFLRKERISASCLSRRANISRTSMDKALSGGNINLDTALRICEASESLASIPENAVTVEDIYQEYRAAQQAKNRKTK